MGFYHGLGIGIVVGFVIRGCLAILGEYSRKRRECDKRRKYNLEA